MGRLRLAIATLLAALGTASLSGHALAEPFVCPPPPSEPAAAETLARSLWQEALTLEPADPVAALDRLRCAERATDRPAIALRIAVISERLGDDVAALASFERYLELAGPETPDAAATRDHIEKLRARIRERARPRSEPRKEAPPPPPPPAATGSSGPPLATWIAGGVGVAGLGAFAVFALMAESEDDKLVCAPNCVDPDLLAAESRRDRYATIANVSLAIGAAAIVVAGVIWIVAPRREPPGIALGPGGASSRIAF